MDDALHFVSSGIINEQLVSVWFSGVFHPQWYKKNWFQRLLPKRRGGRVEANNGRSRRLIHPSEVTFSSTFPGPVLQQILS